MIFLMAYEIEGKKCGVISWIKSERSLLWLTISSSRKLTTKKCNGKGPFKKYVTLLGVGGYKTVSPNDTRGRGVYQSVT
jgi:hypothetical protein